MLRLFKNLWCVESNPAQDKRKRRVGRRLLALESLERRDLMAVAVLSQPVVSPEIQTVAPEVVSVRIINHDLYIFGTNGPDKVEVYSQNQSYIVKATNVVNGRGATQTTSWRPTGGDIFFFGYGGDDTFSTSTFLRANLNGGDGNDTLSGGYGPDNIKGGNGDDVIRGNGSHDVLDGGNGSDWIEGGDGNDIITCGPDFATNQAFGGPGNDTITGGYGRDILRGGSGDDTLDGSYGADDLFGEDGLDMLYAGNDSLRNYLDGGAGEDHLYGSYGNDRLYGRGGNDWLFGYGGDDYLNGGDGYDYLFGGDGDDELDGGGDDNYRDMLFGEAGRDTFHPEHDFCDPFLFLACYDPPAHEIRDFEPFWDNPLYPVYG